MPNKMNRKRVFVSGGAGVIGTALVQSLIDEGADVFVGDLKPCPQRWLGKVRYRQGDLNAITAQELEIFDPEIFFHLAATFERSEESGPFLEENFHHNVKLSHHLINCLKGAPSLKRVIFASSYLIYDPTLYLFDEPQDHVAILSENSPIYPRNICGAAKLFHELELRFLEHFLSDQVSFASARIFRVYGYRSRDVIVRWIRAALRNEPLTVYRPEGTFDYVFADDVADGLLRLAKTEYQGIVNIGSGQSRSIAEVIQILKHHFPHLKVDVADSKIPYESSQASIEKLFEVTGWKPSHSLEKAIPKLIEFERSEQSREKQPARNAGVLITSISKKMPLIGSVREAANKIGQFQHLYGCDSDAFCIGQYGVDDFWHCPSLEALTPENIAAYCEKNGITAVIPTRDGDLEFYSRHLSFFDKRGIRLMVSSLDTVLLCLDKKRFADFLLKEKFPAIPAFLSIEKCPGDLYVVKERKGAGSRQIGIRLNQKQAMEHAKQLQEPIFQPYIEGREWSIDLYRSFKGIVKGVVARHRNTIVGGESQVTTTVKNPRLEQLCQQMADKLNIHGHAVFQAIEDSQGGFHIIECNPRFGGASTASIGVGLDSFFWFFGECLGSDLEHYPFLRSHGEVRQIRYLTDRLLPWSSSSST